MRVLIASDIFPPESGGPATYAVTLANELEKRKDSVIVVTLNPYANESVVACPVHKVLNGPKLLRYAHYLYLLTRYAFCSDVIYAMGPVNAGLPALIASFFARTKFAVKVVGDYAWEQYTNEHVARSHESFLSVDRFQSIVPPGKVGMLKKIESLAVRHADAVITPSQYLKKIVLGWGAVESSVHVVYNEVVLGNVAAAKKPLEERWVVSVARLVPWKGFHCLLDCMVEITKRVPSAKLKIVGDGPEAESIRAKIRALKLESVVEMMGNLSNEKTLAIVKSATLFVLNSGYEGLSHTILEAQALGTPVLASDVGGNPELIRDSSHLFTYNNQGEITEKIVAALEKQIKPERHNLETEKMIDKTRFVLDSICRN